jgi:hypothetical protein
MGDPATVGRRKVCSKCRAQKGADEFYSNKASSDGLSSLCRPCQKEVSREWAKRNPVAVARIRARFAAKIRAVAAPVATG